MYLDVRDYVKGCQLCQSRKRPAGMPPGMMHSIPVGGAWDMLGVDLVGPLPRSNKGNKYVIVFSDYLTMWVEAFPIPNKKASIVAKVLVEHEDSLTILGNCA